MDFKFNYSDGAGRIFTIDNRDYFIFISKDRDYRDRIDLIYRMIYKDSEGKMQIRKFRINVRFPDGMQQDICIINDKAVFNYLAGHEIAAKNFITFLCFGRMNSFVIDDYKETPNAQVISHNVITYVNPIQ